MKKMKISRHVFFVVLFLTFGYSACFSAHLKVPRDTTYNPHHELRKISKKYPEAKIASTAVPEGVIADMDVTYLTIKNTPYGTRMLKADIFRPEKKGKYPAIVLIHGGGWRSGDKSMQRALATRLAARGFVTVCPEYQLSQESLYPAALYNIKAAIRWVRVNAKKYSVDTTKIATSGSSSGGHLSILAGLTSGVKEEEGTLGDLSVSSDVQAIIDVDGVIDFMSPLSLKSNRLGKTKSTNNEWLHGSFYDHPEIWREASPIFWADKNCPPVLFLQSGFPRFTAGIGELTYMFDLWGKYYEIHKFNIKVHPFWLFDPWVDTAAGYMADFLNKVFKTGEEEENSIE